MRLAPLGWLTTLGDRGNVAIMTAVVLPLLLLVGGFATDYGYASYLNQRLTQATDNAVLASVSQSAATAGGGFANTAWLRDYGTRVFNSNVAGLGLSNVTFNLTVTSNGTGGVNSVGSYTYNYPTFFSGIVGFSTMPLTSQIKAAANPITYIDYYILVDVSQSMGIAATPTDMANMWNYGLTHGAGAVNDPSCVFACHVKRPEQMSHPQTNEQIARSATPTVKLRLDYAISAIKIIVDQARSQAGTNRNIRIGIYTINGDPGSPGEAYTTISPLSSNYTTLYNAADLIELGSSTDPYADTSFNTSFAAFTTKELAVGNGSGVSAISPKKYVFIVTDGVNDQGNLNSCYFANTCTSAINPSVCDQIKNKVQDVGVIYTVYNPIFAGNNAKNGLEDLFSRYMSSLVKTDSKGNVISDALDTSLKNCSSGYLTDPKWYFAASDGPGIETAMRNLFASTLKSARLTQ